MLCCCNPKATALHGLLWTKHASIINFQSDRKPLSAIMLLDLLAWRLSCAEVSTACEKLVAHPTVVRSCPAWAGQKVPCVPCLLVGADSYGTTTVRTQLCPCFISSSIATTPFCDPVHQGPYKYLWEMGNIVYNTENGFMITTCKEQWIRYSSQSHKFGFPVCFWPFTSPDDRQDQVGKTCVYQKPRSVFTFVEGDLWNPIKHFVYSM